MMAAKSPNLFEVLTLLEEHAPKLRAAGVLELEAAGVKLKLAPPTPDLPDDVFDTDGTDTTAAANPLYDPTSYGLPAGAELPGFRRPDQENAEAEDEHGRPLSGLDSED